ncbi:MAG TPA: Gfo/Idh/MocA family oxidoreductase [Ardenticatenaceae bacterium]
MTIVKVGIIGCGVIGNGHLRVAARSPLVEVVAVADVREEAARQAAQAFNIASYYASADDLLADPEVEAVVLALPAFARTEIALRAFAAHKHVLLEKPVAMNAAEVEQLIGAQGECIAGCCSSRFRFSEPAQVATALLRSGVLGTLRVVRARGIGAAGAPPEGVPPAWRVSKRLNGGGILMNWGCYDLDYLLGLTGWSLRPQIVLAQSWPVTPKLEGYVAPGSDAETHAVALILCAGGSVISLERGEFTAQRAETVWEMVGSQGALHLQMLPGEGNVIVHDEIVPGQGVVSRTIWEGDVRDETIAAGPLEDFAAAIWERREPLTSLKEALVVQQIIDAIYASAERGEAVTI